MDSKTKFPFRDGHYGQPEGLPEGHRRKAKLNGHGGTAAAVTEKDGKNKTNMSASLKSDAAAGGGTSLEAETKLLSVRIFADLIAVVGDGLRARLEYSHVFDAGTDGLTRSDLAITAPHGDGIEIPIFVLECRKDVRAVHKDHIVCTFQAVLEAMRVVPYIGLADLHRARFHMALVSGCIMQFSVLVPECRDGHMFWVINRRGPTFVIFIASMRRTQYPQYARNCWKG
ncbi:hypothetical protein BC832DRAFT_615448 [Gaertneriomyces semiglobifer]|nr:hypothetical protein BC832DRAFT_615448 [Gaertneriomyces semiglobifer]